MPDKMRARNDAEISRAVNEIITQVRVSKTFQNAVAEAAKSQEAGHLDFEGAFNLILAAHNLCNKAIEELRGKDD